MRGARAIDALSGGVAMARPRVGALAAALAVMLCAGRATAQRGDSAGRSSDTTRAGASDSLFARARRLVLEGNGDAGRALVDSMLAAATGTPVYAEALYWRAALAATAADAERDYRRVIVEHPFSVHAGDALLALAQLEMARGDREPAIDHLQRFLLQRPQHPERVRAGIWLGRLHLEQNRLAKGCAVLLRTRASLASDAAEIRNQVDYYAARCVGVDTVAPPPRVATAPRRPNDARPPARDSVRREPPGRDSVRYAGTARDSVRRDVPARDSARTDTARPAAPSPSLPAARDAVRHTVQVAAYDTRTAAEQLVERLAARGITARLVEVGSPPFRVRVGSFETEVQAAAAARDLASRGFNVFVTTTAIERAPPPVRR